MLLADFKFVVMVVVSWSLCSQFRNFRIRKLNVEMRLVFHFKVGISGYGNLRNMSTYTWATSKSTQLSINVWVKLFLMRFPTLGLWVPAYVHVMR